MNIALTQIFIDTLQSHLQIVKTFLQTVHALVYASFETVHALVYASFETVHALVQYTELALDIAESRGKSPYAAYRDTAHQHPGHYNARSFFPKC